MPKLDLTLLPVRTGSIYPAPYDKAVEGRTSVRLGDAGGLAQFGVNLVTLSPGAMSSLRHWHLVEDEFVMITQGQCILVTDAGETPMAAGDCAAFPANTPDGHHFINRSAEPAVFLVVGTKSTREVATYSDVDLMVTVEKGVASFTHKDGTAYQGLR